MEGYVGYNYEVTQKQSRNMLLGRSSATQFCNFNNIPYEVVDVGIASDDGIGVNRKVARGTKNILHHAAIDVYKRQLFIVNRFAKYSNYIFNIRRSS